MTRVMLVLVLSTSAVQAQGAKPELVLQTGHTGDVHCAAYSADGRYIVTASGDHTAIIWDAATGRKLRALVGHTGSVQTAAFSADGRRIATTSMGGAAIVWDASTGEQVRVLKGQAVGSSFESAAFSPDGKQLLTGSFRKKAELWDIETGKQVREFVGHEYSVTAGFSSDGKRILTASSDGLAIVWDAATGEKLRTLDGHDKRRVSAAAFSPDGTRVVTAGTRRTALIWDVATGKKLHTLKGHYFAPEVSFEAQLESDLESAAFSPDGKWVLTGSRGNNVAIWDATTGEHVRSIGHHRGWVWSVAFSPDGKRVLSGSRDNSAIVSDAATGSRLLTLGGSDGGNASAAFNPDGRQLVTSSGGAATVWDLAVGRPIRRLEGQTQRVVPESFTPDGTRLIAGSEKGVVGTWDLGTGKRVSTLADFADLSGTPVLSSDGTKLVTPAANARELFAKDKRAIVWDAKTGEKIRSFEPDDLYWVSDAALSPDGKRVVFARLNANQVATVRDASTGKKAYDLGVPPNGKPTTFSTLSVRFSPDGTRILTSAFNRNAVLWDAATGKELRAFTGHKDAVRTAAFGIDGKRIVTASDDQTAMTWDAATGERQLTLTGHTGAVMAAWFARDGKRIVTASEDGSARLWEAATGHELCALFTFDAGKDWLVVTPEGLFDGSLGGRERVSFRVGNGLTVVPVDRFFADFYYPGLLAAVMKGERPKPTATFAAQVPPAVRITAPADKAVAQADSLDVAVEVTDLGGGMSGLALYHNGIRVLAPGDSVKDGKTTRRVFKVKLTEGENRLEAKASSGDGGWQSEPARLLVTYNKPLVQPDLYVLAVGVSEYADAGLSLKFAATDAKKLGDVFDRRGRQIYKGVRVTYLLDGKATRAGLREALEEIAKEAQPRDTFVLTVSGHGTTLGQRYYFLPHEFEGKKFATTEENVKNQGIPIDELGELLRQVPALKKVLVLDTCGSGGATGLLQKGRNPFAFRGEIERLNRAEGVFTIAACAASEEAQEPKELGHGVLSYALLAGLRAVDKGPLENKGIDSANPKQIVDVLEWFSYANGQTPGLMKKYFNREQDVHTSGSGTSFPLLPARDK